MLIIANREPRAVDAGNPCAAALWRTCLREVAFSDEGSDAAARAGEQFIEGDAYQLLLEILCGLRSPMIGETQVMGQFKSFLGGLDHRHAWINKIGQRLLSDAREVRTQYLQGLGSRSYGSAIRRHLADCEQAILVGTGKLAGEVLPFLTGATRHVDQWGRAKELRDTPATSPGPVRYYTLDEVEHITVSGAAAVFVIAAPVPSEMVARLMAHYPNVRRVIDLRAEFGDEPLDVAAPVISLQMLFAEMEASQDSARPQIDAARHEIARRGRQYELRGETRPFGWDDLCA